MKSRVIKTVLFVSIVFVLGSCRIFGGKNEKCPAYSQSQIQKAATEITVAEENN
jgi:hypothetical protein